MPVLSKLTGTFSTLFQLGKGGVKVKTATGALSVRDAADTNPAAITTLSALIGTSAGNAVIKAPNAGEVNFRNAADSADAKVTLLSAVIGGNATIKATAGAEVTIRNAADSLNAKVFAADPLTTDLQGLATVNYININPPTTATALKAVSIKSPFSATYTSSLTLPNAAYVTRCIVEIVTPIDAAITIKVGTDEAASDARFQGTGDNNPQTSDTYETTPFKTVKTTAGIGADQKFLVTLSSVPTVGEVNVYFEYGVATTW